MGSPGSRSGLLKRGSLVVMGAALMATIALMSSRSPLGSHEAALQSNPSPQQPHSPSKHLGGQAPFAPQIQTAQELSRTPETKDPVDPEGLSLRGTTAPRITPEDIISHSIGLRDLFDYYLTVQGEISSDALNRLLAQHLQSLGLDSETRSQATKAFQEYRRYLAELQQLRGQVTSTGTTKLQQLRNRFEQIRDLRRQHLPATMTEGFFAAEEAATLNLLERRGSEATQQGFADLGQAHKQATADSLALWQHSQTSWPEGLPAAEPPQPSATHRIQELKQRQQRFRQQLSRLQQQLSQGSETWSDRRLRQEVEQRFARENHARVYALLGRPQP